MAANDDKIYKFHQAINHYAEEQRQKIQDEIAAFKQKELSEAEIEVLNEAYHLIQQEMMQMRNTISREMAQREMEGRRQLLNQRQKITEEVFERAAKSLRDFTSTDKYKTWLCDRVRELSPLFDGMETTLQIREEDMPLRKKLEQAFGGPCQIEADQSVLLGGLRARSSTRGILVDSTLDSLLEDQREWFEENSGLAVV